MAANIESILREGITAYKAGRKEDARALLLRVVELDQYNEQAWLWLSAVVDSPEDQRTCLENVLAINPENERARKGLASLGTPAAPPPPPAASPPADNGFATSVEWAADAPVFDSFEEPAPSADISDDDYDDWVANLNLPVSSTPSNAALPVDDAFSASDPFGGAFFGSDDDDDDLLAGANTGEFPSNSPFSTLDFETVFGTPEAAAELPPPPPEPPTSASPSGLMSPGRERDNLDATFDDIDLRESGVFTAFEDDDFTDTELEGLDTEELFQYIPPEIQPTRLPGTRERYPVVLLIGLVVLVALNAGALALLIYRLL